MESWDKELEEASENLFERRKAEIKRCVKLVAVACKFRNDNREGDKNDDTRT